MNIERREGQFLAEGDGQTPSEIFYQTWTRENPLGTLVLTHGISEHSDCYAKTAEFLVPLGWNMVAWDLRGHGRSEGKRGHVDHFTDYSKDLAAFLRYLNKRSMLTKDFALMGHSMGGLITLRLLSESSWKTFPQPKAIALSSPLLGVALAVPPAKDFAARVLSHVLPSLTLYNEIKYEELTRDPEFLAAYPKDNLRHGRISPSLYLGMVQTIADVRQAADKITLPILIQAAGQDKIVSTDATREFFSHVASTTKKLLVYSESYHEIYNDLDREKVFHDLNDFLVECFSGSMRRRT